MTYRYTFYKIPFSETGIEYPLPEIGNATESLAPYETFEKLGTAAFRENQTEIVITNPEDNAPIDYLLKANYLRVGVVKGSTIDEDTNVNFYWVRDLECLGGLATFPVKVTIAPDDVMTEFFNAPTSNNASIMGRLTQCSENLKNADGKYYPRSGTGIKPFGWFHQITPYDLSYSYTDLASAQYFAIIVGTTDQYGRMRLFVKNDILRKDGPKWVENLSRTHRITYQSPTVPNYSATCEVTNIFVLPARFIPTNILTDDYQCIAYFQDEKGEDDSQRVLLFTEDEDAVFYWSVYISIDPTDDVKPDSVLHFQTPTSSYKIDGDKSNTFEEIGVEQAIQIDFSLPPRGTNTDDFKMLLVGCGVEPINITDDYRIAFSINEAARERAQFGNLYVLKQVSAGIAGLGGAIGGAVSGNYFGAVQSVVGSVESIADTAAETGGPAQIVCNENAINSIFSIYPSPIPNIMENIFKITVDYPILEAYQDTIDYYGYLYNGSPNLTFLTSELKEAFYRFSFCQANNLAGGGQDAQATVENMFVRGVRFKAL